MAHRILVIALLALPALWPAAARADAWGTPNALAISADGRSAYASAQALLVLSRDPDSGALSLQRELRGGGGGGALELSRDGRWLYATNGTEPVMRAYLRDTATGELHLAGEVRTTGLSMADVELTHDGRVLIASQPSDDALVVFDRDPETGALGPPRRQAAQEPGPLALADDDRTLYYGSRTGVQRATRGDDGEWRTVEGTYCPCGRPESVVLSPDGKRLYAGPRGYGAFARDPQSGALSPLRRTDQDFGSGYAPPTRHGLAVTGDSAALFGVDRRDAKIFTARRTDEGTEPAGELREGDSGAQGIAAPAGIVLGPGGRHLYVMGGRGTPEDPGSIAVFAHDEASHALTYRSLFRGPAELTTVSPHGRRGELLIDDGARFTNDLEVSLTIRAEPPYSGFRIWNGDDEPNGSSLAPATGDRYAWQLPPDAPEGVPLTVHGRVLGDRGAHPPLADTIRLDLTDPRIVRVRTTRSAGRRRLTIAARDRVSGVVAVQVAVRGRRAGKWQRVRPRIPVPRTGRLRARVSDQAGNVSRWRVVGGGR